MVSIWIVSFTVMFIPVVISWVVMPFITMREIIIHTIEMVWSMLVVHVMVHIWIETMMIVIVVITWVSMFPMRTMMEASRLSSHWNIMSVVIVMM